jgi:hypothetical protein
LSSFPFLPVLISSLLNFFIPFIVCVCLLTPCTLHVLIQFLSCWFYSTVLSCSLLFPLSPRTLLFLSFIPDKACPILFNGGFSRFYSFSTHIRVLFNVFA